MALQLFIDLFGLVCDVLGDLAFLASLFPLGFGQFKAFL